MTGERRRPLVDLRRRVEDVLGPVVAEEDIAQPVATAPRTPVVAAASGDPRVPVVAAAIGQRWAEWQARDDWPAPPAAEVEAEAVLEALDSWARDEIANTGASTAGLMIMALLSKLSVTQSALHASVASFSGPAATTIVDGQGAVFVSAPVPMATVQRWGRIAAGDTPPVADGLSG